MKALRSRWLRRRALLRRAVTVGSGSSVRTTVATMLMPVLLSAVVGTSVAPVQAAAVDPCAGLNAIACENTKPGSPSEEWDVFGSGDDTIQGFATDISVNRGGRINFKVKTDAAAYRVDIYRLGWYGGNGARKHATVQPSVALPQVQPACVSDPTTFLYDCGTWGVSASWTVPADTVSGIFVARLVRTDNGGASHIPFVVRDDASVSDVFFQTSDTTWQAYNRYGGANMYATAGGKAQKVSYNRPFITRDDNEGRDYLFANEYPMLRFLERNGYDVSYTSGIDSDRRGSLIRRHKVFLSLGHDEYWSGAQRANVEAARDAGVNLAFFSGNEVYWKTRWEPSADGAGTPHRTLVTYKETASNGKVDPDPAWTGTWRDPRFSTDFKPENALTGTMYQVNHVDMAIKVPAAYGKLRMWRNTSVATLAPGTTATLAPHSLGYESNEDVDNGYRPKGLFRLSETTGPVDEYLRDFGSTVTPGTTTHHMTTYRAASGALVFSAGTVQWPWGLDAVHDGENEPADIRMQQATVNLLADMRAQPSTRMAGLVGASRSTDTTAPTSAITSPAAGSAVANGSFIQASGTATDVGGVVAGVEVSLDAGRTWHPASGTSSWSYTGVVHGSGTMELRVRATDDSGNTQSAVSTRALSVSCPCSLFGESVPATPEVADATPIEAGVRFSAATDGWVQGVRFFKGAGNTGSHTGSLWAADGTRLATGTFTGETASGWQTLSFPAPVAVTAGTTYVASYFAPNGRYAADRYYFSYAGREAVPLTAPGSSLTQGNGVFKVGPGFPTSSFEGSNYWVDVLFTDVDSFPPAVVATTPIAGAASVPTSTAITATLSEAIQPGSLQVSVTDDSGATTPGQVSYDTSTKTATFAPEAPLARGRTYAVAVSAADTLGNAMAQPYSWSFRSVLVDPVPGVCPCRLWSDDTVPAVTSSSDSNSVELGVAFTATVPGLVTGMQFYKGEGNGGTHVGSLWTAGGQLLGQATFEGEASTGWQRVTFAQPVEVAAGTQYIASYRASAGRYSYDVGYFDQPHTAGQLRATGGRYTYGPGAPLTGSQTNYWVDVEFEPIDLAPSVLSSTPAAGAVSVALDTSVSAVLSEPIQASSLQMLLRDGSGGLVPGNVSYDAATLTASFAPDAPLARGTTYTVELSASDAGGKPMDPAYSGTFRTVLPDDVPNVCPCGFFSDSDVPSTVDSGDGANVDVGVAFRADKDGTVDAVQFYKAPANTGPHTVSLWTEGGQLVAQATSTAEAATGWVGVSFAAPVDVTSGTTYVASVRSPAGRYSYTGSGLASPVVRGPLTALGGRYTYGAGAPTSTSTAFYGVDVAFQPVSGPLVVTGSDPVAGASGVAVDVAPSVTFSEPIDPASLDFSLVDASGAAVAGSASYDPSAGSATFTPSAALAEGASYEARVRAAKPGAALIPTHSFGFTTVPGRVPGAVGLWEESEVPAVLDSGDRAAVAVGAAFRSAVAGDVVGVQFYRGPANPGPHTGSVWSSDGQLLGSGTFPGGATGWVTLTFDTAVPIEAGTDYLVSYRAPQGGYSYTGGGLASPVTTGPLTALGGRYTYGAGAPTNGSSANFWVDLEFVPDLVVTGSDPVAGASGVAVDVAPSVTFSEPIDPASLDFSLVDASGAAVAGSASYDPSAGSATFTPSAALAEGASYEARVRAAKPGAALIPTHSFGFTTVPGRVPGAVGLWEESEVPAVLDSGDRAAVAVGAAFRSAVAGDVVGVQFYRGPANPGPHTGSVWSSDGQLLGSGTFPGGATGWVTLTFDTAVPIEAGTDYLVSYRAPQGGYSYTGGGLASPVTTGPLTALGGRYTYGAGAPTNGSSANFWVDVEFVPAGG